MKADVCGEGDREGLVPDKTPRDEAVSAPPLYLVWEEGRAITSRPHGPGHTACLSGRGGTVPNHSLQSSFSGRGKQVLNRKQIFYWASLRGIPPSKNNLLNGSLLRP